MNKSLPPLVAGAARNRYHGWLFDFNNKDAQSANSEPTNVKQQSSVDFKKEEKLEVLEKLKPANEPTP